MPTTNAVNRTQIPQFNEQTAPKLNSKLVDFPAPAKTEAAPLSTKAAEQIKTAPAPLTEREVAVVDPAKNTLAQRTGEVFNQVEHGAEWTKAKMAGPVGAAGAAAGGWTASVLWPVYGPAIVGKALFSSAAAATSTALGGATTGVAGALTTGASWLVGGASAALYTAPTVAQLAAPVIAGGAAAGAAAAVGVVGLGALAVAGAKYAANKMSQK